MDDADTPSKTPKPPRTVRHPLFLEVMHDTKFSTSQLTHLTESQSLHAPYTACGLLPQSASKPEVPMQKRKADTEAETAIEEATANGAACMDAGRPSGHMPSSVSPHAVKEGEAHSLS